MLAGHVAELAPARGVEAEAHDRLVLLEGRLGVDQALAADLDPLAHHHLLRALLVRGQEHRPRRQVAGHRLLQRRLEVDQVERQLGGLAEQALDALGVLLARHLDQDPVVALALDRRLAGADLVDPPAHDLERLAHRGILELAHRALGQADVDPPGLALDHLDLARRADWG